MNKIKDASSFFLWEDSGDSEVDRLSSHPYEIESNVDDDQEDAQSCSCDGYASELRALDFQEGGDDNLVVGLTGNRRSDQLGERRRSGAGLDQYNSDEEEEEEEEEEESSNNVDVIRNMNEMEDKVFWDTCMAGGYP